MRLILSTVVLLFATQAFAQSEHLDEPVNYESLELRLMGCKNNLPIYFHKCITNDGKGAKYSEAQIGKAIKSCNVQAWHKFFDCTGLYPKPSLTKQIEGEVDG